MSAPTQLHRHTRSMPQKIYQPRWTSCRWLCNNYKESEQSLYSNHYDSSHMVTLQRPNTLVLHNRWTFQYTFSHDNFRLSRHMEFHDVSPDFFPAPHSFGAVCLFFSHPAVTLFRGPTKFFVSSASILRHSFQQHSSVAGLEETRLHTYISSAFHHINWMDGFFSFVFCCYMFLLCVASGAFEKPKCVSFSTTNKYIANTFRKGNRDR